MAEIDNELSTMTPAHITRLHRSIWQERSDILGVQLEIDDCPYTSAELADIEQAGRRVAYLPAELAAQNSRTYLGTLFPRMRSFSALPGNPVTNDADPCGWFDYDAGQVAPHLGLSEAGLRDRLEQCGRSLLTLNQYIVASHDSKTLTGSFLDERRTWSRIGSRLDGRILAARFDGSDVAEGVAEIGTEQPVEGSLLVAYDVDPGDRFSALGGRSAGTPRLAVATIAAGTAGSHEPATMPRPEPNESELHRQVTEHIRRGFHAALGLSEDEYRNSMPRLEPQPDRYRDRFDIPLLVEPRIPWELQAALADVALSAGTRQTGYTPVDRHRTHETVPYLAWFSDWDQRFPEAIGPADALNDLKSDEVGGILHEAIAMDVAYPHYCRNGRFWDVIGMAKPSSVSSVETGDHRLRFACMYFWRGRSEIGANLHPIAYSIFRPLVRGQLVHSGARLP